MTPFGASPVRTQKSEQTSSTTSIKQATPHQADKQAALDKFSEKLASSPRSLVYCQNLLRQAIYGSRCPDAQLQIERDAEHIRSLIVPKTTLATSLTSRNCPESAALAVIACVYQAFGDKILTEGEIDEGKLTLGLYMMFGKEMPKIKSDVLSILHKNFRIGAEGDWLHSANYSINVEVERRENYNAVVNAGCTDPTYFYGKPAQLLLEFFGKEERIPTVLQNISDLEAVKFTLPKSAEAFDVLAERCKKMKRGDPIHSNEVTTTTATGDTIKLTTEVAFFVDSLPTIYNKLVKKTSEIAEQHAKRSALIATIEERAQIICRLSMDVVAKDVGSIASEWVVRRGQGQVAYEPWLSGKTVADLDKDAAILCEFGNSFVTESCEFAKFKIAALDDEVRPPVVDLDDSSMQEIQEADESSVAMVLPDTGPAQETSRMFKRVVNCWSKTTTINLGAEKLADKSTVVFVGTQAFKQDPQDRVADARTILDQVAHSQADRFPKKKKILVYDQRLLSPAGEGKLYTRHTVAMKQAAKDFNDNSSGQTMEYLPMHSRAEGAWAAWATWVIELCNTVLGQLNIDQTIELAPKIETDFMTFEQCTAARDRINDAFKSMSSENQKKYEIVLAKWRELFYKREVPGNAAVFSTLSNILQDAINEDALSPYCVQLIIGCKSGIDRSTADPVVMDMLKPLILMELERTRDSNRQPRTPDLKRFFDPSTGELCLRNLSEDEIMIVTNNHDPNLMIRLSQLNNAKASNVNPHILLATMRQFYSISGMALRTFTGKRPS